MDGYSLKRWKLEARLLHSVVPIPGGRTKEGRIKNQPAHEVTFDIFNNWDEYESSRKIDPYTNVDPGWLMEVNLN